MAVDQQILVAGTSAVPLAYTVPNAIEAALLCVNATIDGTGASGQFLATVEIVSDGGVVVARCPCFTTLAVGGSAEISWFRLRSQDTASQTATTAYENLIFSIGGLVLYWKLDDAPGSTTIVDSKGGHTGSVVGTVTLGQPPLADVTSALFTAGFCGQTSRITGINANGLMTLVVWVNTVAVNPQNAIAWADTSSPDGRWFQAYTDAAGKVNVVVFGTDATPHTVTSAASVNDGAKHMVGFTFFATDPLTGAGAVGSIYIDGALDTATPIAMGGFPLAQNNQALVIGAKWSNAFDNPVGKLRLAGTLDEFAIFTSVVSATQMAQINTAGRV